MIKKNQGKPNKATGYVLALIAIDCVVTGYYVSDDVDVTKSISQARRYTTLREARRDARICNEQWFLNSSERFAPVVAI